jgi:transcriptional regulator with XRE-family HTH domain
MQVQQSQWTRQTEIVKTFGARMVEARELCGYSQKKAAKLLGYRNSSKLAKIEAASDTNSVPLWLIPKAAEVYEVSIDYLFGVSACWQREPIAAQEKDRPLVGRPLAASTGGARPHVQGPAR